MMDEIYDLLDSAAKRYPMKALADDINKAESTLRNELNRQDGYKLGLQTAILIMRRTGDLAALDRIEALFNRTALDLPEPADIPTSPRPLVNQAAGLMKETSEALAAVSDALHPSSPGGENMTAREASKCASELDDVIDVCTKLKAYCDLILKR